MRWAGHVGRTEEDKSVFKMLTGKIPLGRLREDDIRMNLEEIGINAGIRVDLAQDRGYWRALVNPRVP